MDGSIKKHIVLQNLEQFLVFISALVRFHLITKQEQHLPKAAMLDDSAKSKLEYGKLLRDNQNHDELQIPNKVFLLIKGSYPRSVH